MIDQFKKLTISKLRELCKKENYKGYSKLKKKELIEFIQNQEKKLINCKTCKKKIYNNQSYINHPNKIMEHIECYIIEKKEKTECSVCLEEITNDLFITDCKHKFHKKCINQWYDHSSECPNCRGNIYKILSTHEFVMKLDDKIKNAWSKINFIQDEIEKDSLKKEIETEFRLIIHNFMRYYLTNTSDSLEIAINTLYNIIDELGFN